MVASASTSRSGMVLVPLFITSPSLHSCVLTQAYAGSSLSSYRAVVVFVADFEFFAMSASIRPAFPRHMSAIRTVIAYYWSFSFIATINRCNFLRLLGGKSCCMLIIVLVHEVFNCGAVIEFV